MESYHIILYHLSTPPTCGNEIIGESMADMRTLRTAILQQSAHHHRSNRIFTTYCGTKKRRTVVSLYTNMCQPSSPSATLAPKTKTDASSDAASTTHNNTIDDDAAAASSLLLSIAPPHQRAAGRIHVEIGLAVLSVLYGCVYYYDYYDSSGNSIQATAAYCTTTTSSSSNNNCSRPDLLAYKVTSGFSMLVCMYACMMIVVLCPALCCDV